MSPFGIVFFITLSSLCSCKTISTLESIDLNSQQPDGALFDYDYIPSIDDERKSFRLWPNQKSKVYSTPTTERPIIRYWNNFIRSLPLPSITWNMTNPFVNLFNNGEANIIESPIGDYQKDNKHGNNNKSNYNKKLNKKISKLSSNSYSKKKRKSYRTRHSHKNRNQKKKYYYDNIHTNRYRYEDLYSDYNNDIDGNHNVDIVVQRPIYYYNPYGTVQQFDTLQANGHFIPYHYDDYDASDNNNDEPFADEMIPPNIPTGSDEGESEHLNYSQSDEEHGTGANEHNAQYQNLQPEEHQQESSNPSEESVRNAIGSFMTDSKWNMKRQQSNSERNKKKPVKEKFTGKTVNQNSGLKFFFLRPL